MNGGLRRGDSSVVARALYNIGSTLNELGRPGESISFLRDAIAEMAPSTSIEVQSLVQIRLASTLRLSGELEEAIEILGRVEELLEESDNERIRLQLLGEQARIASHSYQYGKAIEIYREMLPLAQQHGAQESETGSLIELAHLYAEIGETEEAKGLYQEAINLYGKSNDQRSAIRVAVRIGDMLAGEEKEEEALEQYRAALSSMQGNLYTPDGASYCEAAIGTICMKLGRYREAHEAF